MFRLLRILMVVGGVVLVVFAVGLLNAARSVEERFTWLLTAKPICLPVDLSIPGSYSGRYERNFDASRGDMLRLNVAGLPSLKETQRALAGLSAEITLKDESGQTRVEQVVSAADFHQWGPSEEGLVVDLALCDVGDYQLTVCVNEPAKGMVGHPHCLIGEYKLTGLEKMPALVFNVIGVPCLVIGMALMSLNGVFRSRTTARNNEQPQGTAAPHQPRG
jgi:hypothetical protein